MHPKHILSYILGKMIAGVGGVTGVVLFVDEFVLLGDGGVIGNTLVPFVLFVTLEEVELFVVVLVLVGVLVVGLVVVLVFEVEFVVLVVEFGLG